MGVKRVAVTGSISSGKTLLCHELRNLGAYVVSADQIVHQILSTNTSIIKRIVELLGSDVVQKGKLDRKKMAELVFSNPEKLKLLEAMIHPVVKDEIEKLFSQADAPLLVAEIPLLFEAGMNTHYQNTVTVVADEEIRLKRFVESGYGSSSDFFSRQSCQLPQEEKAKRADYIIDNSGSKAHLRQQAVSLYHQLI